ncbi:MAG: hypothetical protein WCY79_00865 [Bacteroidales bacterium]
MIKDLIVVGAGNPDIVRIIEDINREKTTFNFLGFTDKNQKLHGELFLGYPILGNDNLLEDEKYKHAFIVNNIYSTQEARKKTNENLIKYKERYCNIIHPTARVGSINIGEGNIIADGVIVQSCVRIGNYNVIHSSTIISHETVIGNNNLFSVNVTIGSRSQIGDYCYFGISATTLPVLTIEDGCYIGGGSVLCNSIKSNSKVFGNPARFLPTIKT